MEKDYKDLERLYRTALLEDVVPFWEKHSLDREHGGYFTCLDRVGNVFDTDKFVWLQCRQVWLFSMLHNRLEKRLSWLEGARLGADFLAARGMDPDGNWYFSLDREGRPLVQPYNIFSDCFAAMAFAQYHMASGDESAGTIALNTYENIRKRRDNPKGKYSKVMPGTRPMVSMALPMILANLALEMEHLLGAEALEGAVQTCVHELMTLFLDESRNLLFENVAPDGSHPDCFEGRLVNPGHGIEAMWFLMQIAERTDDSEMIDKCVGIVLNILEFGWDREHGGIFYFLDALGHSPQQLEWDQKLWWVHLETLVALCMAYRLTGSTDCWSWYEKVHEYAWNRFPDPEHGEWFGYLNRRGERLFDIKGGKWKGCFHVPRALYLCWREFQELGS